MSPFTRRAWILLAVVAGIEAGEVRDVEFQQATDGTKRVFIQYTLAGDTSDVRLELSVDGGASYQPVEAGLEGDAGAGVPPGPRAIELDLTRLEPLATPSARFRILAPTPLRLVDVPAGAFTMSHGGSAHEVELSRGFRLGRAEVTNLEYAEALTWARDEGLVEIVGDHVQQHGVNLVKLGQSGADGEEIRWNSGTQRFELHAATAVDADGAGGPGFAFPDGYDPSRFPAVHVSWYGAARYCDWRSLMEGLPPYYDGQRDQVPEPRNPYSATGYRLPSEAEWERAARHDDGRSDPWGEVEPTCELANNHCQGWTSPVDAHPAGVSALGLLGLSGNAHEWCNDWFAPIGPDPSVDPAGPPTGTSRVHRGGGFGFWPPNLIAYWRLWDNPAIGGQSAGLRICRTLQKDADPSSVRARREKNGRNRRGTVPAGKPSERAGR